MLRRAPVILAVALILAGCAAAGPIAPAAAQSEAAGPAAPAPAAASLVANGAAQTLAPSTNANLSWAAAVVKVDHVPVQSGPAVKLFGFAGGDPAMNGLYTYIAFLNDPHEPWQVYQLGDFLDYRVLAAGPGRVDLELHESTPSTPGRDIGSRTRRVIVAWTIAEDGAPATVTLTPAQ